MYLMSISPIGNPCVIPFELEIAVLQARDLGSRARNQAPSMNSNVHVEIVIEIAILNTTRSHC